MTDYPTIGKAQQRGSKGKFIGRNREKRQFDDVLDSTLALPQTPTISDMRFPHIVQVIGIGGMGKTTLVREFLGMAEARNIDTLYIDAEKYTITDPDVFMNVLYRHLRNTLESARVDKALKSYRDSIEKRNETIQKVSAARDEYSALVNVSAKFLGGLFPGLVAPIAEEAIIDTVHEGAEAIYKARTGFMNWIRERGVLKDDEFTLAVDRFAITRLFMEGLAKLTDQRPLVIALDTYEVLEAHDWWLVETLYFVPPRLLWIVAGREIEDYLRRYRGKFDQDFLLQIRISEFSNTDIAAYLKSHNIEISNGDESELVHVIQEMSKGIPLAVEALVNLQNQGMNITQELSDISGKQGHQEVVAVLAQRFLKWTDSSTVSTGEQKTQRQQDRRWLLTLALLGRVEPSEIQAISDNLGEKIDADSLIADLSGKYSFVFSDNETDLHAHVREILREYLRQQPLSAWMTRFAETAYEFFHGQLEIIHKAKPPQDYCREREWQQTACGLINIMGWLDRNGGKTFRIFLPMAIEAHFYDQVALQQLTDALADCNFLDPQFLSLRALWLKHSKQKVSTFSFNTAISRLMTEIMSHVQTGANVIVSIVSTIGDPTPLWSAVANFDKHEAKKPTVQVITSIYIGRLIQGGNIDSNAHQLYLGAASLIENISDDLKNTLGNEITGYVLNEVIRDKSQMADSRLEQLILTATHLAQNNTWAWFALGTFNLHKNHFDDAISALKQSIAVDNSNSASYGNLGHAFNQLHKYEEALQVLNRCIVLDPKYSLAHTNRGHALEGLGLYNEAIEAYNEAIKCDPQNSVAFSNRGVALNSLHRYEDALSSYDRSIEINPQNALAHSNRAETLIVLGRFDEALYSTNRAIEIEPNLSIAHVNKGDVLRALKKYNDALESYSRATNLDPQNSIAHNNRGTVLFDLHKYEDALSSYDRAIQIDPHYVIAHSNRAEALKALGQLDEALHSIDGVIEIEPNISIVHVNKGDVLMELNRYNDALESYSRAISLDPQNSIAHNNRGNLLLRLHKYEEAFQSYSRALAINERDKVAYDNLGYVSLLLGRSQEALDAFNSVLRLDPNYPDANLKLGFALISLQTYEDARKAFDRNISNNPKSSESYFWIGQLLRIQGDIVSAEQNLLKAIELKNNYLDALVALVGLYKHVGQLDKHLSFLQQAGSLVQSSDYYAQACLSCIAENLDQAMIALKQAVEKQPGRVARARVDPDLEMLREKLPDEFKIIVVG